MFSMSSKCQREVNAIMSYIRDKNGRFINKSRYESKMKSRMNLKSFKTKVEVAKEPDSRLSADHRYIYTLTLCMKLLKAQTLRKLLRL